MRRIPRLRQGSGLSASTPRSLIVPPVGQRPSASPQIISVSHRKPVPPGLQCPAFIRLYSNERQQPSTGSLGHGVEEAQGEELQNSDQESGIGEPEDQPPQWQTYIPPPRRSHAERFDEVSDSSYQPALTADGLETVGGLRNWWDQQEHWPESADFVGFKPPNKVVDPAVIETSVRRAIVEAFALRQAGREGDLVSAWPIPGKEELRRLMEVDIRVAGDGDVSLVGDVAAVLESLVEKDGPDATEEPLPGVPVLTPEEAQKYKETWDQGWKAASLSDPRIKFAVTKRIFQLTGQLLHDHQLLNVTDVRSLLRVAQKPPKPKTLTQEIQERNQDLVQLPNVSVATKRVTRGDKEKALGRFKLIEEELRKRDLPLEGHGFVRKNRELSRLKGGT